MVIIPCKSERNSLMELKFTPNTIYIITRFDVTLFEKLRFKYRSKNRFNAKKIIMNISLKLNASAHAVSCVTSKVLAPPYWPTDRHRLFLHSTLDIFRKIAIRTVNNRSLCYKNVSIVSSWDYFFFFNFYVTDKKYISIYIIRHW